MEPSSQKPSPLTKILVTTVLGLLGSILGAVLGVVGIEAWSFLSTGYPTLACSSAVFYWFGACVALPIVGLVVGTLAGAVGWFVRKGQFNTFLWGSLPGLVSGLIVGAIPALAGIPVGC